MSRPSECEDRRRVTVDTVPLADRMQMDLACSSENDMILEVEALEKIRNTLNHVIQRKFEHCSATEAPD